MSNRTPIDLDAAPLAEGTHPVWRYPYGYPWNEWLRLEPFRELKPLYQLEKSVPVAGIEPATP